RPTPSAPARSAAANRDCRLAAVLAPNRTNPISSRAARSSWAAVTTATAPTAPISHPAVRAGRRPRRTARFDSGTVKAAAPSVIATTAIPAHAAEPVTSSTNRAPTARPAPVPIPPTTWTAASVASVRRCQGQVTSGPDRHTFGRIQPQGVVGGRAERLVEGVDVPHHLIAAELRRRVRIDGETSDRLGRAHLGPPGARPGQEEPLVRSPSVDLRVGGVAPGEPEGQVGDAQSAEVADVLADGQRAVDGLPVGALG